MTPTAGVVVPIRGFDGGKSRLAADLDAAERARLLQEMAEAVVAAAGSLAVVVVSSAPEVRAWAARLGHPVLDDPGSLDGAAAAGLAHFRSLGCDRVIVAHADLPRATDLTPLADPGSAPTAVLVPDRHDDGTPVLSIPAAAAFAFAYGPGSFARHRAEARRLALEVVEWRDDPTLRHDVDSLDDLEVLPGPRP